MNHGKSSDRYVLVTGGAGFIGSNLSHRFLSGGKRVVLFDNLSRPGIVRNVEWLQRAHGSRAELRVADIRDAEAVREAVGSAEVVFHLAAQVAVTNSIVDPSFDFDVNARGTLNVLEAVRESKHKPPVVYTSTNKVYGELADIELRTEEKRYTPVDEALRTRGIDEKRALDLRTPYGCSKGTGERYLIEYARTYGLRTVALRMSCIYGPRQMGNEDQGWVAHFFRRALTGEGVTIYGDGKQVRDILYVDDLVEALTRAYENAHHLAGSALNLGGGPTHTLSLLELVSSIEAIRGKPLRVEHAPWRGGDQRYFVSCHRRFSAMTGWEPRVEVGEGLRRLHDWVRHVMGSEGMEAELARGAVR